MTTTPGTICVDREIVLTSFRRWEVEQAELDAQLAESVEALIAYQSHLDTWQQQLAQEREDLRQLRTTVERDRALAGAEHEHMEQAHKELNDARQKITSLTAVLLARTEELRDLDHQRGDTNTELALARAREKEFAAALAAQQQSFATERQQLEWELTHVRQQLEHAVLVAAGHSSAHDEPSKNGHPKAEPPRSASPVLGSVMEQFGKLRQQRSMGRPNHPKPR